MNDVQRAADFKQLVENPRFREAFDEIERDAFEEIAGLKLGEASEREKDAIIHRIQIIRNLWATMEGKARLVATEVQQVV